MHGLKQLKFEVIRFYCRCCWTC